MGGGIEWDGKHGKNAFSDRIVPRFIAVSYAINPWLAQLRENLQGPFIPLNGSILSQKETKHGRHRHPQYSCALEDGAKRLWAARVVLHTHLPVPLANILREL